ncbi:hypothetical protein AXG93_2356s1030 [Marchantia polymorpha subsp. ruderalis]|uniref:Uncharacterized protein n=1 Tax=Marchantia polymorpha subsp. ruderalis TaxID=1480154 RepID=A0A176WDC6_MARPO|nr:hypothetical protein AXG93_2356s1030 [Marchantia polymorpha subsp. ruderalis]
MQEVDDMLTHINHVRDLVDPLNCLNVPIKDEYVVVTLLESLPPFFDNLITALDILQFENLAIEFVTANDKCTQMKTKEECLEKFKELKAPAKTQSEHKIKAFWKIINNRNVTFNKESTSVDDGLKMSPSGRSESSLLVLMSESSKPTSSSDHEDAKNAKKENEEEEEETNVTHSPTSSSREGEGE